MKRRPSRIATSCRRQGQAFQRRLESGAALVYTLVSVAILSMFLSIVYERVLNLMRSSREWLWRERVLAAAESGVALSQARLLDNPLWSAGEKPGTEPLKITVDGVPVEIRTQQFRMPDVVWVFSSGSDQRVRKETIQPLVVTDPTLFAVLSRKSAKVGSGSIITGSMSAARVRLEAGAEVVGSIISSGELFMAAEQVEAMVFDSAASPPPVPELDLKNMPAVWRGTFPPSSAGDSPAGKSRYVRSSGDLSIKDWSGKDVSIYIPGNLKLEGNVNLESSLDTPILIVGKDLTGTLQGSKLQGSIYVRGKVVLRGEGLITGTLIADDVDIAEGVVVQSFGMVSNSPRPAGNFWNRRVDRIRN